MEKEIMFAKNSARRDESIIQILSNYKYYFKSVTEFENYRFNIVLVKEYQTPFNKLLNKMFGWQVKFKKYESILTITTKQLMENDKLEFPIVISREEVNYYYKLVPDNYIGADIL